MKMAFNEVDNEIKVSDYNISVVAYNNSSETYQKLVEVTKLDNVDDSVIVKPSSIMVDSKYYTDEYINYAGLSREQERHIYVVTLGAEQYNKYIKLLNLKYDEIKDKAIVLNNDYAIRYTNKGEEEKYMKLLDIKVGDIISGTIINNSADNATDITVGYLTDIKPFGFKNNRGPSIILSDEYYDSISDTHIVEVYIKSSDANKLQDEIELVLNDEDIHINNNAEDVRIMRNLFTLIGIFLYGFIIVITLIGVTNIFNTITTNMELRKQEFAMLRSVGMTNKEFKRMIRLETLFMGLKALIFGIPIGIGLSYLIYYFLERESGLPYELPIKAIIIAVISVFLLISLIMTYSISKINKQNIIETIRNENI
jgi:putative ABC transport system permease protein